jgi:uncharacterized LabA/DUF88 family protein
MKIMSDERVCIFVDGENLFHSQKRQGIEVDYLKLKEILADGRKLVRPYYYGTRISEAMQDKFFDLLRHVGYEVKVLPLIQYGERRFEKGLDVMLVTDMLVLAHRDVYDVAILVAGDRDYLYAVKALKEMGKRVEVSSFDNSCSRELGLTADSTISLTRIAARIQLPLYRPEIVAGKEVMGREAQGGVASKADLSA